MEINDNILTIIYDHSVSCDLSAAPAPGQSVGPGTRLTLTEKDQSIPA